MQVKMRVRIAELAKEKGLSRSRIARKADVTVMTVHRWNRGKALPSKANIEALQKVFGCETKDLFDFE